MNFYINIFIFFIAFAFSACTQVSSKAEIFSDEKKDSIKTENINIDKKYLLGKIDATKDSLFVTVPQEYCIYRKEYLLKEVYLAYKEMYDAAEKEGISLKIVSAFRDFDTQKWLWERKFSNKEISETDVLKALQYSSMPGISRHHWGSEIDMASIDPQWYENTPQGQKTYNWLKDNAAKFGFYQPYTANRNEGFNEEKWHWSYKKISLIYIKAYKNNISNNDISGFKADTFCEKLSVIEKYVFSINADLLDNIEIK